MARVFTTWSRPSSKFEDFVFLGKLRLLEGLIELAADNAANLFQESAPNDFDMAAHVSTSKLLCLGSVWCVCVALEQLKRDVEIFWGF